MVAIFFMLSIGHYQLWNWQATFSGISSGRKTTWKWHTQNDILTGTNIRKYCYGQIMACCLFGAKLSSKPVLGYCQLDPYEQISVKFYSNCKNFSFTKMHLKISSANWQPFCPGGGGLNFDHSFQRLLFLLSLQEYLTPVFYPKFDGSRSKHSYFALKFLHSYVSLFEKLAICQGTAAVGVALTCHSALKLRPLDLKEPLTVEKFLYHLLNKALKAVSKIRVFEESASYRYMYHYWLIHKIYLPNSQNLKFHRIWKKILVAHLTVLFAPGRQTVRYIKPALSLYQK